MTIQFVREGLLVDITIKLCLIKELYQKPDLD